MKKFAVAYIDFFYNELTIEIIEAKDWQKALLKHSEIMKYDDPDIWLLGETLQETKENAFDSSMMIDIKEII